MAHILLMESQPLLAKYSAAGPSLCLLSLRKESSLLKCCQRPRRPVGSGGCLESCRGRRVFCEERVTCGECLQSSDVFILIHREF